MTRKLKSSSAFLQCLLIVSGGLQVSAFRSGSSSCKEILKNNPDAPSAVYTLTTPTGRTIYQVYCEMGLSGGGYTFLHPADIQEMTNNEVQAMFNDTANFLVRIRLSNGTQPYGVITPFPADSTKPFAVFLNSNPGYPTPNNSAAEYLGAHYLYFGLTPAPIPEGTTQGFTVNGEPLSFDNCDGHPNSYFALFPNNGEAAPVDVSEVLYPWPLFSGFVRALKQTPSMRVMPDDFFMFFEIKHGGCGLYAQADAEQSWYALRDLGGYQRVYVISMAMGFR